MAISIKYSQKNSLVYNKGDVSLLIHPFDNYHLFTLYQSNSGTESKPIDLTNVGDLYLCFVAGETEVRIKEFEDVVIGNESCVNTITSARTSEYKGKNVGEVVFRISKDDARKILALSDDSFYITAKFSNKTSNGNFESDETVLYSGRWADYSTYNEQSIAAELATFKSEYNKILSLYEQLQGEYSKLNESYNKLSVDFAEAKKSIETLQNQPTVATVSAVDVSDWLNNNLTGAFSTMTDKHMKELNKTTIKPDSSKSTNGNSVCVKSKVCAKTTSAKKTCAKTSSVKTTCIKTKKK